MSKHNSIKNDLKQPCVDPGEDITSAKVSSDEADATDLLLDSEPLVITNSYVAGPLLKCHQSTRASMSTRRHDNLSLLSVERELADSLDNKEIIAPFNSKPRRLRFVL